jgi:hypothetical protein
MPPARREPPRRRQLDANCVPLHDPMAGGDKAVPPGTWLRPQSKRTRSPRRGRAGFRPATLLAHGSRGVARHEPGAVGGCRSGRAAAGAESLQRERPRTSDSMDRVEDEQRVRHQPHRLIGDVAEDGCRPVPGCADSECRKCIVTARRVRDGRTMAHTHESTIASSRAANRPPYGRSGAPGDRTSSAHSTRRDPD